MSLGGAQAPQLGCVEVCNGGGQRRDRTAVDFGGRPTRLRLIVGKMPSSTIDSVCDAGLLPTMYGPPRDCKGEVWSRRQVCANVFGLYVEIVSPGHDELRAYPSL